jgi:hypothetical protein
MVRAYEIRVSGVGLSLSCFPRCHLRLRGHRTWADHDAMASVDRALCLGSGTRIFKLNQCQGITVEASIDLAASRELRAAERRDRCGKERQYLTRRAAQTDIAELRNL